MAKAFPASRFFGFDYHHASIDWARQVAKRGVWTTASRSRSQARRTIPGSDYDLIAYFDSLHDMGDPVGSGATCASRSAPNGTWLLVEPFANDRLEDNLNPVGRMYYAASTMLCMPNSLAQEVGAALGAQAGEARLKQVATQAGFTRFRRAAETPFNLVFEARALTG